MHLAMLTKHRIAPRLLLAVLAVLIVAGCNPRSPVAVEEMSTFLQFLKERGVDGSLAIEQPSNDDIEYVATISIATYTSTRALSLFRCQDEETAQRYLLEALENPRMSGQSRNGPIIMAATFFPPDEEAVEKIVELFPNYDFDQKNTPSSSAPLSDAELSKSSPDAGS